MTRCGLQISVERLPRTRGASKLAKFFSKDRVFKPEKSGALKNAEFIF
jgi:hypothetical protein